MATEIQELGSHEVVVDKMRKRYDLLKGNKNVKVNSDDDILVSHLLLADLI